MAKNDKRLDKPKLEAFINLCITSLFGEIGGSSIQYEVIDVNMGNQTANIKIDAISIEKFW